MIKKYRLIIFMSFLLMCFTGCQNKSDIEEELPEIVFICSADYSQISLEGETQYVRTFIDKNGNKYVTSDPAVTQLGFKELIEKFSQGDLDDKIELLTSYDNSLIEENYKKLRETALNEDVSIEYPEFYPDVQLEKINSYGIIYGKDDNLEYILLHKKERMRDCYSKNEIVNSIYEWYIETFQIQ